MDIKFCDDKATVRLVRDVDQDAIFQLCDEIDLCVDYYKYHRIEIEINSPGGEAIYLEHYLRRLAAWRGRSISIATVALAEVASAAAIILALGDVGRRSSYSHARILFHPARAKCGMLTAADAVRLSDELKKWDKSMEKHLASAIVSARKMRDETGYCCLDDFRRDEKKHSDFLEAIDRIDKKQIGEFLSELLRSERFLTAHEAQRLCLIDTIIDDHESEGL